MILGVTFSKPGKDCERILGREYIKVKITRDAVASLKTGKNCYFGEFFTQKQAFQRNMSLEEVEDFIKSHAGSTFKNAVVRSEGQETTYMANRHGEIKVLVHENTNKPTSCSVTKGGNRQKNYILKEGIAVPFLVRTGVMNKDGKVIDKKYDKFRQINRFLEFIKDILPEVTEICTSGKGFTSDRPLHIADFGCGKSYLTFAAYYYLTEIEHIPVEITGLDLKQDVIAHCQNLAKELSYDNLNFYVGDVAKFSYKREPDIIITLHACDTATDYALNYAISHKSAAILSVPCCQHELNLQMNKIKRSDDDPFASLSKWGILQERFAALATDALRAELLEQQGYNVQILEFIDVENTPKNLLIRAVQRKSQNETLVKQSQQRFCKLKDSLGVSQTLDNILNNK